jgi:glycosyltransferase involved in cell wall biosynthesis
MKLFQFFLILFVFEINAAPKISVIIPVYNTEQFLRECLDSVLNQTFTDFEVICINDASTDRSLEILREYAAKDKRIRILYHGKNIGMAAARNTGLDAATGEYIAFCDSDDYIHPDMFKIMYTEIRRNNCELVICQTRQVKKNDIVTFSKKTSYETNIFQESFINVLCYKSHFSVVWDKLYKRSIIGELRFDTELFGIDDTYFNWCIAYRIKKYATVSVELYNWRQHDNSAGKAKSLANKRLDAKCKLIEKIHNSSKNCIPLSMEKKRAICCRLAALAASLVTIHHNSELFYAARRINNLYSKGFIDLTYADGIARKILLSVFVVMGKIQKLMGIQ